MEYTANVKVPTIQIEMKIDTTGDIDTYEVVGFARLELEKRYVIGENLDIHRTNYNRFVITFEFIRDKEE